MSHDYPLAFPEPHSLAEEAPQPKGTMVRVARTANGEHPELVGGTYPIVCRFEGIPQLLAQGLSGREYRIQYGPASCLAIPAEYLHPAPPTTKAGNQ